MSRLTIGHVSPTELHRVLEKSATVVVKIALNDDSGTFLRDTVYLRCTEKGSLVGYSAEYEFTGSE